MTRFVRFGPAGAFLFALLALLSASAWLACSTGADTTRPSEVPSVEAGSPTDGNSADAGSLSDAASCVNEIPDAEIYGCDAEPEGGSGCPGYSPSNGQTYPLGCGLLLPQPSASCGNDSCCPPQTCVCQTNPASDGGALFTCPL